ncbi:MAG TPA: D-alanine--D-alanine ligase [Thermoanaerobaculia bacterium]|nr:D-alanine--D-alanine ligase [Thermoanaerobaculia bacterium]
MRIGLTYDLRDAYLAMGYGEEETAELDRESTIEAIESTLRALGHETDRIGHAKQLAARLVRGDRWDLVFNIAEGLHGIGREAQVPALLDLYQVPYTFSDPLVMSLTLHKGMTKRVVRDAGVPTPDFAVVESEADAAAVDLPLPLFVKPVAEGTGKGVTPRSIVRERAELWPRCAELIARYRQAALVETMCPGREFTTGILGTGDAANVVATIEVILLPQAEAEVYSYVNKENCEELCEYRLVTAAAEPVVAEAERVALAAWRALGCRDGGRVDLRCDAAGQPQFLEVNPLAGIHPEHSDLPILATKVGMSYRELIGRIVESAATRVSVAAPEAAPMALVGGGR